MAVIREKLLVTKKHVCKLVTDNGQLLLYDASAKKWATISTQTSDSKLPKGGEQAQKMDTMVHHRDHTLWSAPISTTIECYLM